jgi:hypothetical protein
MSHAGACTCGLGFYSRGVGPVQPASWLFGVSGSCRRARGMPRGMLTAPAVRVSSDGPSLQTSTFPQGNNPLRLAPAFPLQRRGIFMRSSTAPCAPWNRARPPFFERETYFQVLSMRTQKAPGLLGRGSLRGFVCGVRQRAQMLGAHNRLEFENWHVAGTQGLAFPRR